MGYKIGAVADFFGISCDAIRYYEKEGLIKPRKDKQTNYREYSLQDIFDLSDILFYRDIGTPIWEIREQIYSKNGGDALETILRSKEHVKHKIEHYTLMMQKLQNWERMYREAIENLDVYRVCAMPLFFKMPEERRGETVNLKKKLPLDADYTFLLTQSFEAKRQAWGWQIIPYFSFDEELAEGLPLTLEKTTMEKESYPRCLFAVKKEQECWDSVFREFEEKAEAMGLTLAGNILGKLTLTNDEEGQSRDYYRFYAPLL